MTHIHGENVAEVNTEAGARMEKSVQDLSRAMSTIRTGRASIALLDPIKVDYYGTPTPLSQMATLATPNPTTLTIQPWDITQLGAIEKAIQVSDLGINPANDGKIIRLAVPPLTTERRQDLVKRLHDVVEQHRVAVRNIRRDANEAIKQLEKGKAISEDEGKRGHELIQKTTDGAVKRINAAGAAKEKEILEIG
ncbi:MAG: ribosome recycling factor [Acidobacteriia bacterium]|nr:ribosome recycling factor [Terriglobia bacterium]MYG02466.1 ribosome recycling factor [Terriglobia bacterium]MYK11838.1 ribosome recycling factor [Terriglobia bacterium]